MSCNPFKLNKLTAINNPSSCFPDIVFDNICKLEETGKRQFDEFLENRMIKQKVPINAKITENKFTLLGNANLNKKEKLKDMKIKQTIITKLRTALSYREKECDVSSKVNYLGLQKVYPKLQQPYYYYYYYYYYFKPKI